MQSRYTK